MSNGKSSDHSNSVDDIIIIAGETAQTIPALSSNTATTAQGEESDDQINSRAGLTSFARSLSLRGLTSRNKLKKVSTTSEKGSESMKRKKNQPGNTIIIVSPSKASPSDAGDSSHPVSASHQMLDNMYAASYESMMPAVYPPPPASMYSNSHMSHVNPSMMPAMHSAPSPYSVMHSSSSHHFPPPPHFPHHHHSMMHPLSGSSQQSGGRIHFEEERERKKRKKKKKAKARTTKATTTTTTTTTTPKPPTEIFFGLSSPFASAQNTYNTMAEMRPSLMSMMANGYGSGGGKDDHSGPIELGKIPQIIIRVPAPIVNVPTPIVNVPPAIVNVSAPIVNVPPTEVMVPTPIVNVPPAIVNVSVPEISIPPAIVNVPKKLILRKEIKIMSKNKGSKMNPIEMENEEFDTGYKSSSTDLAEEKKNLNSPTESPEEEDSETDSEYQEIIKSPKRYNHRASYSNRYYNQPASVQLPPQQPINQQTFYQPQPMHHQQQQQQQMYPPINSHQMQNNNRYNPVNNQYQGNGYYANQYGFMQGNGQGDMKGNYNGQMMQQQQNHQAPQQQQQQQQQPPIYFPSINSHQQMSTNSMGHQHSQHQHQQDNQQMNQQSHQSNDYPSVSSHANSHRISIPPVGHTLRVTIPVPVSPNILSHSLMTKELTTRNNGDKQTTKGNEDRGKSDVYSGKNGRHQQEAQEELADENAESNADEDDDSLSSDMRTASKRQLNNNKLSNSMKNEDIVTLLKLNNAARRKYASPNYGSNIAVLHDDKQQPNIVFEKSDTLDDRSMNDNTNVNGNDAQSDLLDKSALSLEDYSAGSSHSGADEDPSNSNEAASSPNDDLLLPRISSSFTANELMMYQDQRDAPVYADPNQSITALNKSRKINVSERRLRASKGAKDGGVARDEKQKGEKRKKVTLPAKSDTRDDELIGHIFNNPDDPGGGESASGSEKYPAESVAIESRLLPAEETDSTYSSDDDVVHHHTDYDYPTIGE